MHVYIYIYMYIPSSPRLFKSGAWKAQQAADGLATELRPQIGPGANTGPLLMHYVASRAQVLAPSIHLQLIT